MYTTPQSLFPPEEPDHGAVNYSAPSGHGLPTEEAPVQRASLFARGTAFLIDLTFLNLLFLFLGLVGFSAMRIGLRFLHLENPSDDLVKFIMDLYLWVWTALFCVYFIFFIAHGGQTPAKKLLKIRVLSKEGGPVSWRGAFVRTLGYLVSGFPLLGLGFLMSIFHPQKRALHDLLSGTIVVKNQSNKCH